MSFTLATLITNSWLVTPPEGSVATITTELLPKLACKGVPVNSAVLLPLSVKVKKPGNVEAVIVLISLSSSVIVIL